MPIEKQPTFKGLSLTEIPKDDESFMSDRILETKGHKKLMAYIEEIMRRGSFNQDIKGIRKRFNIPVVDGVSTFFKNGGMVLNEPQREREFFRKDLLKVLKKYDLSHEWYAYFSMYVMSGIQNHFCVDKSICKLIYKHDKPPTNEFPVAIGISPNASQREIIDFIKKMFPDIKRIQDKYKTKGSRLGKVRTKNPRKQEIGDFIYENQNLPYREIVSLVCKKFPEEDTESIDEGSVGKIISLENKRRK